jgi:hypothetical protein
MATLHDKAVTYLSKHVEEILSKQNEKGEFWPDPGFRAEYNTDYQQFAYYPLAYLFTLDHPNNAWKGNARVLDAVVRSLRNNLAIEDADGGFMGSSHDQAPSSYPNNWRSFSFLKTWELVRDHIDKKLAADCEDGLRRALKGLHERAKHETSEARFCRNHNVRNHPSWHLLGTFLLARQFNEEKIAAWAAAELERICACQHPAGVWFEHNGPVTVYQHVTMSSLSHYYTLTQSPAAKAALDKSLSFYRVFTYPSAYPVETLDGRVRYTGYVMSIHPAAWSHCAEGRSYLHFVLDRLLQQKLGPGYQTHGGWLGLPFFTQFTRDLPQKEPSESLPRPLVGDGVHEITALPVRQIRRGPWVVTLSGFTRPEAPKNRWELDYQAHVSIFHERSGLIVGGGGGKRQAALSLFSGGSYPLGLPCLASVGTAETTGAASARIHLDYPGFKAILDAEVRDNDVQLTARVEPTGGAASPSVFLQLPFPMKGEGNIVTSKGHKYEMDIQDELTAEEIGTWIGREKKFKFSGFVGARALIHILPYNTHWRDGRAPAEKAMAVVAQPLSYGAPFQVVITPDA